MPMAFEGSKRSSLFFSMILLACLIGGAVLATSAFTNYFRSQDPINQCINDPESQPFQLAVPVTVKEDGVPALVPKGVGIKDGCIRPVHTLEENVIHVSYNRRYDTKVFVNDLPHTEGDLRDIVLKQGDMIRIEFQRRN